MSEVPLTLGPRPDYRSPHLAGMGRKGPTPMMAAHLAGMGRKGPTPMMAARLAAMRQLLAQGYTVREAGRELGLTRWQAEDTAAKYGLRALQGAVAEAKHEAAMKGAERRWGTRE